MGRKAAMVAVLAKNMERQPAVRPEIKRKRRSLSLESRITCLPIRAAAPVSNMALPTIMAPKRR